MIIVTGAGGKTGKAIVAAFKAHDEKVTALVRRPEQAGIFDKQGVKTIAGDYSDPEFLPGAFRGGRAVYHICSNMNPAEVEIAGYAIEAARSAGIEHFIYHSVLHPQVEAMPHHWLKMRVEERLFTSGIPYTILQPGPYMQNVLSYWKSITGQEVYPVPYSMQARLSMVDLEDVAQVAARVILEPGHIGAIYELAGPEALSQVDVCEVLSRRLKITVIPQEADRGEWERRAQAGGMDPYSVNTLLKMFVYYDKYGLVGNSRVLEWLLQRPACRFDQFVERSAAGV